MMKYHCASVNVALRLLLMISAVIHMQLVGHQLKIQGGPRTVLIIGASRGIGLELAKLFSFSSELHATARNMDPFSELDGISGINIHRLDVRNESQLQQLADEMIYHVGKVDLLIHNAGINQGSYNEQMQVNAVAPFRAVEAIMPAILKSSDKKVCIITSDVGTQRVVNMCTRHGFYCAYPWSKFAANMLFREREPSWREKGVVAVAIQPGYVSTDMNRGKGSVSPVQSSQGIHDVCLKLRANDAGRFLDWQRNEVTW